MVMGDGAIEAFIFKFSELAVRRKEEIININLCENESETVFSGVSLAINILSVPPESIFI